MQTIDMGLLSRDEIAALLKRYQLSLTIDEALTIQHTFLKRPPTLAECVLWSIQGSEHCAYKSSRPYLKKFNTESPDVILGAKEDAGIVSVATDHQGLRYGIVVSHESHNHPSQIVPYEGAATGVGGNVRDVSCMGAEVIAIADGLRFGDITKAKTHWIHEGVVSGIAGYGNPIGVPNIAGDLYYHPGYNDNCLVTVVTLGAVREDHIIHSYAPEQAHDEEYIFILVGKPTDNSGFGGAAFASSSLEIDQSEKNKGAVQEPNAFLQRHILKANVSLFKQFQAEKLINTVGFKDLGAGGIACASVELADTSGFGAEITLELVPVSMMHLDPAVILCSETQERFMWVVPKRLEERILAHYNERFALPSVSNGAMAKTIGKIRHDGQFVVTYKNKKIVDAKAEHVTKGLLYERKVSAPSKLKEIKSPAEPADYQATLLALLAHENIASRAPIFERYDKQVQGRTVIEAGCADAGVMQPFNNDDFPPEVRGMGIALSLDQNPRYNLIDPFLGAIHAVCESIRNVVAVGATPVALTDCLCFGNPEIPEQMWAFAESTRGIIDACAAFALKDHPAHTLPVIAGNVSLYNTSGDHAIPPSPMIACLGRMPHAAKAITYDFKQPDSSLILIGERQAVLGGSVYYQLNDLLGDALPTESLTTLTRDCHAVTEAIWQELVMSAHDVSDGGVAVALAEMSVKNQIGVDVTIPGDLPLSTLLFGEAGGFILEVRQDKLKTLTALLQTAQVIHHVIGKTTRAQSLNMNNVIALSIEEVKNAWQNGLRDKLL